MKPTSLVDIFRADCDEPVLSVAHVGTKFHDHVGELIKVRAGAEVLDGLVFKLGDLLRRKPVHLDYLQGCSIRFEGERELLELSEAFVKADKPPHILLALMSFVLLQQL